MMKFLKMRIVHSMAYPDLLSIRLDAANAASAFRRALVDVGFKAGDRVVLVAEEEYNRLIDASRDRCQHGNWASDCMNCNKDH